jgi:O-antigen/teichoic acid export membrane protein
MTEAARAERTVPAGGPPSGEQASLPLISGALLVRNGMLNILGQGLPLVIGVLTVPLIVTGLGAERFGILVFTWTLIGAFSLFDLGLGWSVTRFVADALGRGERRAIPEVVWPAVIGQAVVGGIGGGLLVLAASPLVQRILHVSPQIRAEAITAFQITGLSLPVVLITVSLRGALEAAQRFDITSIFKAASSASVFLVPLAGVLLGWALPGILLLLLAVRVLLLGGLLVACQRTLALFRRFGPLDWVGLRRLYAFGGWVMVSALTGLILAHTDRLVIGGTLPMTALTYYTVPQELVARLGIITATLAAVLFPAFSTLSGAGDPRLRAFFHGSIKYGLLLVIPVCALLAGFAFDILRLWLGASLAEPTAPVLRILAIGVAAQSLAAIPSALVGGMGRPDLIAKLYLVEAPLYVASLWWLVHRSGITGAALAWTIRFALDGLLLLWATGRMGLWGWRVSRRALGRILAPVSAVSALVMLSGRLPLPLELRAAAAGVSLLVFLGWIWAAVLRPEERMAVRRLAWVWHRRVVGRPTGAS